MCSFIEQVVITATSSRHPGHCRRITNVLSYRDRRRRCPPIAPPTGAADITEPEVIGPPQFQPQFERRVRSSWKASVRKIHSVTLVWTVLTNVLSAREPEMRHHQGRELLAQNPSLPTPLPSSCSHTLDFSWHLALVVVDDPNFRDTRIFPGFSHRNSSGVCGPKTFYAHGRLSKSVPHFNRRGS